MLYFIYLWGRPQSTDYNHFGLIDVINGAIFQFDGLRGFGWACARKSYVSIGKLGRP
jgi:hypothetical protein